MSTLNIVPIQTTYSFKDLVGALVSPLGTIQLTGGNQGFGRITITMATERAAIDTGADGVTMPSYIAGASGAVEMEIQQTSALHHYFLDLYNSLVLAADAGEIATWAAMSMTFRTVLDGSTHILSGLMFSKVPDKPYEPNGQKVRWHFMACNIQNI